MNMSKETYDVLKRDIKAVIDAAQAKNPTLYCQLNNHEFWDALLRVEMERQYTGEIRKTIEKQTGVPCVLEPIPGYHMGRDTYDQGLDDSHIATAFRKMAKEFAQ